MSMLHSATAFTSDQEADEYGVNEALFVQEMPAGVGHRREVSASENNAFNRLIALLAELKGSSIKRAADAPFIAPGSNDALLDLIGQPGWRGATDAAAGSDEINAAVINTTMRVAQIRSEVGSACALLSYAIATAQENEANRRVVDILKEKRSRLRSIERRLHV